MIFIYKLDDDLILIIFREPKHNTYASQSTRGHTSPNQGWCERKWKVNLRFWLNAILIFQRIILKTHNKKSIVYSSRAGNGDSNIDRDEVDKGNKTNNRISRIKSAVSKARERLKRDTSNSSCSSDSENILSSEEDADVPTSLNISNRGYVIFIKICNRGSNLLI